MSARDLETLRTAHPSFGKVADTLVKVADTLVALAYDETVTPQVYDRVCDAIFTVLYAWSDVRAAAVSGAEGDRE